MPRFSIAFHANDIHIFEVEAENEEEAERIAEEQVEKGEEPDRIAYGILELDSEITSII